MRTHDFHHIVLPAVQDNRRWWQKNLPVILSVLAFLIWTAWLVVR